jgi:8-oxo-dGTP diphosphatase
MLEIELVVLTIAEGKLRLLASSRGLPACTLGRAEPLDRAAQRLLREEVSADHLYLEQLYTFVLRGGRVVVGYLALVRNAQIKRTGAIQAKSASRFTGAIQAKSASRFTGAIQAKSASRFTGAAWHEPLPRLPNGQHAVAEYGLTRLRNKITYTNLAFAFLPDRFTLSELQNTYEVVQERSLDKRNFRKRILTMGILTADGVVRRGGRPACLYRFTGPREVAFWPSFAPTGKQKSNRR